MKIATFFFLIAASIQLAYPFSVQAAPSAKELSEEEEIALMMEQLEQFKASW